MEILAAEGIDLEIVPTEEIRKVVSWALGYYFQGGQKQAPTREAMVEQWGEWLTDNEIELPDPDAEIDTIEWAIEQLKGNWVQKLHQDLLFEQATEMAKAAPDERLSLLHAHSKKYSEIALKLQSKRDLIHGSVGVTTSIERYQVRKESGVTHVGMSFGFDLVDAQTFGIHPGELAILAAPPKTGKSFFLMKVALYEWRTLHRPCVLFTLENSVSMTYDRMVCMAAGVDPEDYQRGSLSKADEDLFHDCWATLDADRESLCVIQPEPGSRTPELMLRQARVLGAESVYIDQLSFIESPATSSNSKQWERTAMIMRSLRNEISTGRDPLPLLVAHQINREGVKKAESLDYLEMYHLADGSEVERSADFVFALHQSHDDSLKQQMKLQTLASRRVPPKSWLLQWRLSEGTIDVMREADFEHPIEVTA